MYDIRKSKIVVFWILSIQESKAFEHLLGTGALEMTKNEFPHNLITCENNSVQEFLLSCSIACRALSCHCLCPQNVE